MGKSPLPGSLRLVQSPFGKDDEPQSRDTLLDAIDEDIGMLLALPTRNYPRGSFILDTEVFHGFYVILDGKAIEFAVSQEGEPDADRITLGPKDVIGLEAAIRVEALTDIMVAVIDADTLASASPVLRDKAKTFLLDAACKRSTDVRRRLVERDAKLAEQTQLVEALQSLVDSQRHEFEAKLLAKQRENEDQVIDNARLSRRVQTLTRELENKNKELLSAANILELYKQTLEETEETLEERSQSLNDLRKELAELSGLAPALERMMASENPEWIKAAQKALTLLYTQGKKP